MHQLDSMTRQNDHATSVAAAKKILEGLSRLRRRVFNALRKFPGGLNDIELESLERFKDLGQTTARKRRSELMKKGYVKATGEIRNGSKVWAAVDAAEIRRIRDGRLFPVEL